MIPANLVQLMRLRALFTPDGVPMRPEGFDIAPNYGGILVTPPYGNIPSNEAFPVDEQLPMTEVFPSSEEIQSNGGFSSLPNVGGIERFDPNLWNRPGDQGYFPPGYANPKPLPPEEIAFRARMASISKTLGEAHTLIRKVNDPEYTPEEGATLPNASAAQHYIDWLQDAYRNTKDDDLRYKILEMIKRIAREDETVAINPPKNSKGEEIPIAALSDNYDYYKARREQVTPFTQLTPEASASKARASAVRWPKWRKEHGVPKKINKSKIKEPKPSSEPSVFLKKRMFEI